MNWRDGIAWAFVLVIVVSAALVTWESYQACAERHGVLVRGLFSFECIKQ